MVRLMTAEIPEEGRARPYDLYRYRRHLLRTDLLHEAAWRHVKTAPWWIFIAEAGAQRTRAAENLPARKTSLIRPRCPMKAR